MAEITYPEYRSSFSQHMTFVNCPRTWYYSAILKVPQVSDMSYANAGTAVHKALDKFYGGSKVLEDAKKEFEFQWNKLKLDETNLKLRKDDYWLMVLNGTLLDKSITTTEMKIFFPELVAYLDGVDTVNDEIVDWKTSTRSEENEHEYRLQLRLYSMLYNKKFGRIPKKSTIHYLKYSGTKSELSFNFNEEDIKEAEQWYNDILQKMKYYIANPKELPHFNHNYFFCPYKAFWGTEDGDKIVFTMHIFGNQLQLEGPVTELLEKGIKKKFSYELKNAHWIKKARPMANTTVCFWNTKNKVLPIGFRDGLIKTLTDYAQYKKVELVLNFIEHRIFNDTKIDMPEKFINGKELRDYQNEAVDVFLRKKVGILELGTGAGKTEIAIETIRRLKCKTLFITDKIELLRQTRDRIKDSLGIEVGTIGGGEEDNIKDVTVATIQTLNKNKDKYKQYLSSVRFVIFDETHKVAANSYVKISRYLIGTEYRMGLSGTAYRDDGNDMMIFAVTGDIIHNLGTRILIERGWLVKPQITFIKDYLPQEEMNIIEDQCKTGLINETAVYSIYYDKFITNGVKRNLTIFDIVHKYKDKKILILTKLIEHGQILQAHIPDSQHLYGATSKEDREEMFKNFVSGKCNVLISTISIFSEGIDIPSLDIVLNASANRGDVKTIQVLGRVLRKLEGKKGAMYIDFWDETKFFRTASNSRKRALQREGHDVDILKEI